MTAPESEHHERRQAEALGDVGVAHPHRALEQEVAQQQGERGEGRRVRDEVDDDQRDRNEGQQGAEHEVDVLALRQHDGDHERACRERGRPDAGDLRSQASHQVHVGDGLRAHGAQREPEQQAGRAQAQRERSLPHLERDGGELELVDEHGAAPVEAPAFEERDKGRGQGSQRMEQVEVRHRRVQRDARHQRERRAGDDGGDVALPERHAVAHQEDGRADAGGCASRYERGDSQRRPDVRQAHEQRADEAERRTDESDARASPLRGEQATVCARQHAVAQQRHDEEHERHGMEEPGRHRRIVRVPEEQLLAVEHREVDPRPMGAETDDERRRQLSQREPLVLAHLQFESRKLDFHQVPALSLVCQPSPSIILHRRRVAAPRLRPFALVDSRFLGFFKKS